MPPSRSALNDSHAPLNLRGEPRDPQKSCEQAADGSICECMCFPSSPLIWSNSYFLSYKEWHKLDEIFGRVIFPQLLCFGFMTKSYFLSSSLLDK